MNVLACEGQTEVILMLYLLQKGYLIFDKREILDRTPIHLRQPEKIRPIIETLPIDEKITIYRIGDTLTDVFDISCFGKIREEHIDVIDVCTKPEIEILIIICENKYRDYLKYKSKMSPKEYVKSFIDPKLNFEDYIKKHEIIDAIMKYKTLKEKEKNRLTLADLIKH